MESKDWRGGDIMRGRSVDSSVMSTIHLITRVFSIVFFRLKIRLKSTLARNMHWNVRKYTSSVRNSLASRSNPIYNVAHSRHPIAATTESTSSSPEIAVIAVLE